MQLTSPAFSEGADIPEQYTCDGKDLSPPLAWTDVPPGTKSLALICDDPDAPAGDWVHWVLFDVSPALSALPEGVPPQAEIAALGCQGRNDFRKTGYGGPCPPRGTHRYVFTLYALDRTLGLSADATKQHLVAALRGHVLAESRLTGKYTRR